MTSELPPDDPAGAEDTLNAVFGTLGGPRSSHYRLLSAKFTLRLSAGAQESLAVRRADSERIRRLEFLKAALYTHPDLLVLDHLERTSGFPDNAVVAELQRLSRSISSCGAWWQPFLELWETVGAGFADVETQCSAMQVLLENSVGALRKATAPPERPAASGRTG